jgi:hypothetical protein
VLELKEPRKNDKVGKNISLLKKDGYIFDFEVFAIKDNLPVRKIQYQAEACAHSIIKFFSKI